MLYFSPLIVLLCILTCSAVGFNAGFTAGFLPIPASCSVSLKSRKPSISYVSDPGYCVAWKGGAGFDECSHSALLKADCPSKHQYLPWWQLLTLKAAGERCCIQILCAPTGYCLNANQICEGGESSPFVHSFFIPVSIDTPLTARGRNPTCDGGPENMNCCVLRLPSKPSGECEDDLYVMPSTSSKSHVTDKGKLDPHCVKTFLTTNVVNHQMILRVITQSLVPAVPAWFSISLTRITSQRPLKMADPSTGAGKGAVAIRNWMSRISPHVHLWRNI